MESSQASVSQWLSCLKRGGDHASQQIWERYYAALIRAAHRKLGNLPQRSEDANDVAQEAFVAFFKSAQEQRFPKLDDRDDLWQVLLMLVERRASDLVRKETADKRGGDQVIEEDALDVGASTTAPGPGMDGLTGPLPTPETIEGLAKVIRERWTALGDGTLCKIALDKLQGFTNTEIAERNGMALRSVERKLRLIKDILSHDSE